MIVLSVVIARVSVRLVLWRIKTFHTKSYRRERGARLSLEMIPPIPSENIDQNVIDAQHRFAKKQYDHQFTWEPSPEIEAAIVKEIFG